MEGAGAAARGITGGKKHQELLVGGKESCKIMGIASLWLHVVSS